MRTIWKKGQPDSLTQWRAPRLLADRDLGMECTYEEMRRNPIVLKDVEDDLIAEQGGICAYTGHRIEITHTRFRGRHVDFHIEHLTPQDYCKEGYGTYGKDADYQNIVACWPRPNCGFEPAYGAKCKDNWPEPENEALFVSPLRTDCSNRFKFNHRGKITVARANDLAAETTITRLGLDHYTLEELRRNAIHGALNPKGRRIRLADARKLLREIQRDAQKLNEGERVTLRPFCFAIEPAVQKEIRKLEGILGRR